MKRQVIWADLSVAEDKTLARLWNRAIHLLNSLSQQIRESERHPPPLLPTRNRRASGDYNDLRNEIKAIINDPDYDRLVPPLRDLGFILRSLGPWSIVFFYFGVVGFLLITLGVILSPVVSGGLKWILATSSLVLVIVIILPWGTGSIRRVHRMTEKLTSYLANYIGLERPGLASQMWPDQEVQSRQRVSELESVNRDLRSALQEADRQISGLKQRLAGLATPSQYEIDERALHKLDSLERTRLLEAVQAYRVNAWTPAAAVCGMILEGRLQRLCRVHGMPAGGIGDMIRRLGEAGLLRSYYQDLAQVGEFFRHRASHPTSEEFDREKTTLVLTSLVILIRDLL